MTFFRLIRGFCNNRERGLVAKGYSALKTWSNMPKKETYIKTRNSLVEKGFVSILMDLDKGSYIFRLKEKILEIDLEEEDQSFSCCAACIEREPLKVKKGRCHTVHTEKELHIKKYSF